MSDQDPTLQDVWHVLSGMNRRLGERFESLERQMVAFEQRIGTRISAFEERVASQIGALKESIEARDFRLDEHGRRLTALEEKLP